jgi:hypothetical protein
MNKILLNDINYWIISVQDINPKFKAWYFDLSIHCFTKNGIESDYNYLFNLLKVKEIDVKDFNCFYENFMLLYFKKIDKKLHNIVQIFKKNNEMISDNHWNWKGGITPENKKDRCSSKYKNWRISVFLRDKYTCQKCNKKGGILNAHHIIEFAKNKDLRFDINNGITLCKKCHINLHSKKLIK